MAKSNILKGHGNPFYVLLHPIEGFQEMRYKKAGNPVVALISVFMLFFALFAKKQLFGFAFRIGENPEHLNLPLLFVMSFGICLGFTLINWSICTLFDGSGSLRDIWVVVGYSVVPYVLSVLLSMVLSWLVTYEEAVFVEAIQWIGFIYGIFLLLKGIEAYHEYSFKGSIMSVLFTVIGIILTILLGILLFSVVQQFVAFIVTIYQELQLR